MNDSCRRSRSTNAAPTLVHRLLQNLGATDIASHLGRRRYNGPRLDQTGFGIHQRLQIGRQWLGVTGGDALDGQEIKGASVFLARQGEIVFQMRRNDACKGPSRDLVGKIQHLNGTPIQQQRLQNGRHERFVAVRSRQSLPTGLFVAHPIPRVDTGKIRVDIGSPLLQRCIDILNDNGRRHEIQTKQHDAFPSNSPRFGRVLDNVRDGVTGVIEQRCRIHVVNGRHLVGDLQTRVGAQQGLRGLMIQNGFSKGPVATDNGTENFPLQTAVHPVGGGVVGWKSRHASGASGGKSQERFGQIGGKTVLAGGQPYLGGGKLLCQNARVHLVFQRHRTNDNVFQWPVPIHQRLQHG
mmetsp:Transcript_9081/g.25147  ORF Transcript_9081/g.25147 Transcript_9081/m.25147 type:complete len:352 (+) Transcript_9081:69-1124(+)